MIPDFGESDVLHLNLPLKHILSDSLKRGDWPLWTPLLSSGFPILAEGQIGTFYLPNLVLFRFLPTVMAYNLNLAIAFLLSVSGVYLFIRKLGLSSISATFASIVFTFSGFFSVHLNHFNLIQAASLTPLLFWAFYILWEKRKIKFVFLSAFFLSQQIFTGHFYIVFISIVGIIIFWLSYCINTSYFRMVFTVKGLVWLILAVFLAILLSSIQLLPTFELWRLSSRSRGLTFETVTSYPYPYKHLATFINPYAFGTPADGSYPAFSSDWGIFWENTAYIGIFPLLLALFAILFFRNQVVKVGLLLLVISLLLLLGKFSPIYFVFSLPPFNLFRVPSKFLLLTVFSLSILAGAAFEKIIKILEKTGAMSYSFKVLFITIIFALVLIDEYRFSYNYPPVTPAFWWTESTQTANFLSKREGKIASFGASYLWNSVFLEKGWTNFSPYRYFRNSLYPNYNALSSLSHVDINTGGLIPNRSSLFSLLTKDVDVNESKSSATISALTKNALSLASTNFLISSYELVDSDFVELMKVTSPEMFKFNPIRVYQNNKSYPRSYIVFNTEKVTTIEQVYKALLNEDFLTDKKALVEEDELKINQSQEASGSALLISEKDTEVVIEAKSNTDGILVLTDTNYPGWQVSVNNKSDKIITVNLYQRGVYLPEGNYTVSFFYQSNSFLWGKRITILTSVIVALVVFASSVAFPGTFFDRKRLFPHLYNKGQH